MCRSRRELSNEYLLAKIGVDTAEHEPLEVWGKFIQYYSFVSLAGMRIFGSIGEIPFGSIPFGLPESAVRGSETWSQNTLG